MDLSNSGRNSTSELQAHYQRLMAIADQDELKRASIDLLSNLVGRGLSEKNFRTFCSRIGKCRNLQDMQFYITQYILAGSGNAVVGNQSRLRAYESRIDAIASFIVEDSMVELTDHEASWKELVESYGFYVGIRDF